MIKIVVNRILGFAIHPNVGSAEQAEIIAALPVGSSVGFIDVAPTRDVFGFIARIEQAGHRVESYADHHKDPRRLAEVEFVTAIEFKLGRRAVIAMRDHAPSCIRLVAEGEWSKNGITAVMFHADFDGFLGYLKGCGASYPDMEQDADILDGGLKGMPVSRMGRLLADAHENLVPAFSQDSVGHQAAKQRIYQLLADRIAGQLTDESVWDRFVGEVETATRAAEQRARELAASAEPIFDGDGNVVAALSNFLPFIKAGQQIAIPLWKREVLRRFGEVLLCSIGTGHMGEQVYIELPKAWQGRYDLRDYLPRGVVGRMPFRVQVPVNRWDEFLANWTKGVTA